MLVEVSDWTLGQDRGVKLAAFAKDGIPIYWIVNLVDRQVEVYTRPVKEGRYRSRKDYKPGQQVPVVIAGQPLPPIAETHILPRPPTLGPHRCPSRQRRPWPAHWPSGVPHGSFLSGSP